jgi:hypothetical protein
MLYILFPQSQSAWTHKAKAIWKGKLPKVVDIFSSLTSSARVYVYAYLDSHKNIFLETIFIRKKACVYYEGLKLILI